MILNLINGKMKDAKQQKKQKSLTAIEAYCREEFGWSPLKSQRAAYYLKTGNGFQAFCDTP